MKLVTAWPVVTIVVVLVGIGALAYPAKDLSMALPTSGHSLPGTQDRETFDEITSTFGIGFNGPLIMTVDIVELDDPIEALDGLKADVEKMPGVHMVAASTPERERRHRHGADHPDHRARRPGDGRPRRAAP